jgi:hydroxymethylglutaryl-CoA synthase
MLLSANPIIAFDNNWATSTKGVFDFFKPYRTISKQEIEKTTIMIHGLTI